MTDVERESTELAPALDREVMLSLLAIQRKPSKGTRYPAEVVERTLLEVAAQGGNLSKARQVMEDLGIPIALQTVSRWKNKTHRVRYEEICEQMAPVLREKVARDALEHAQNLHAGEQEALKQSLSQLADADAVGASVVLRNMSSAKQIALQTEASMRGRAGLTVEVTGLDDLTAALVKMGVGEIVSDAEVVDEAA